MSAPIINLTTSVLGYPQWAPWEYAPSATGLDTSTPITVQTAANFGTRLPDATVATTAALATNTYSNGTAGVGATLTATGNGALTIDGYAVAAGDRVLVKNEAAGANNGLYIVTDPGSSGAAYVLTRDTSMNTSGGFVGFLQVNLGTLNSQTIWLCPANAITVGTTAVTFYQWKNRWSAWSLPPGMTVNIATGVIAGAATQAGVFVAGLQVSNTSGPTQTWSAAITIAIGIEAAAFSASSGIDLDIDIATGLASLSGGNSSDGPNGSLINAKEGDQKLIFVHFKKGTTDIEMGTLGALKIAFKEFEPDNTVVIGGGATSGTDFQVVAGSSPSVYVMLTQFIGSYLAAELSNYEQDGGTFFNGIVEIEWLAPKPSGITLGGSGLTTLRGSSRTFGCQIERNLVP